MANERFQNVLRQIPQRVPPVWMMRQAGRYHRHYQNLRKQYSFMDLCKVPELAAQVALGPIEDFDFDVAIMFSDLLFPLEALGMGLTYDPGPKLAWRLDSQTIKKLRRWDDAVSHLVFQNKAMRMTRDLLPTTKSLIGFVGGPWTLFTYAVEGEHKGALTAAKSQPQLFEAFCELLLPLLTENIRLQLEGGAEIVMIFDTAGGELSPDMYQRLQTPVLEKLATRFPKQLGYYAKGLNEDHLKAPLFHGDLFAGLGFDHRWDLAKQMVNFKNQFLQGNFDQSLLFLPSSQFAMELKRFLAPFQALRPEQRANWVCGLGHGVLPGTPEDHVRHFVQTVRETFS